MPIKWVGGNQCLDMSQSPLFIVCAHPLSNFFLHVLVQINPFSSLHGVHHCFLKNFHSFLFLLQRQRTMFCLQYDDDGSPKKRWDVYLHHWYQYKLGFLHSYEWFDRKGWGWKSRNLCWWCLTGFRSAMKIVHRIYSLPINCPKVFYSRPQAAVGDQARGQKSGAMIQSQELGVRAWNHEQGSRSKEQGARSK